MAKGHAGDDHVAAHRRVVALEQVGVVLEASGRPRRSGLPNTSSLRRLQRLHGDVVHGEEAVERGQEEEQLVRTRAGASCRAVLFFAPVEPVEEQEYGQHEQRHQRQ